VKEIKSTNIIIIVKKAKKKNKGFHINNKNGRGTTGNEYFHIVHLL
jgi:hypothetical protein